jgi:hypothetical protein
MDRALQHQLNILLATFALLLGGFTIALMFLLGPILFWILTAAYCFKFSLQIWAWQKAKSHAKQEQFGGLHFLNYNHVLSAWVEWLVVFLGFAGTIVWIKFLAPVLFG